MASLVLLRTPPTLRRIPYRQQRPPRNPFIAVTALSDERVVYNGSGIDNCRFYRLTTTPNILVLVIGTNRGTDTGFSSLGEAWETASGVFALPGTRGHPEEKNVCVRKMRPVWDDYASVSQADFTTAMNLALNQVGYLTAAGAAIT